MSVVSMLVLVFAFTMVMKVTRQDGRWRRRNRGLFDDQGPSPDELAEIERRLANVEQLENRVLELENRLDFAERLLTSRTGQGSETP